MSFYLKKSWIDQEAGIEDVEVFYATVPLGTEPGDGDFQQRQMKVEGGGDRKRRGKVLKLPRSLDGSEEYLLYHFFRPWPRTHHAESPTFVEEIVANGSYTFVDWQGDYTNICVYWSIGGWGASNFTAMFVDGIPLHHPLSSLHFYGRSDDRVWLRRRLELLDSMPLPHVFRGKVHGPRGSQLLYCYHVMRRGDPAGREYDFWDSNHGIDYVATLDRG